MRMREHLASITVSGNIHDNCELNDIKKTKHFVIYKKFYIFAL